MLTRISQKTIIRLIVLATIPLLFVSSWLVYAEASPVIRHNVYINDYAVGGLTPNEAHTIIKKTVTDTSEPITVIIDGKPYLIQAESIELIPNIESAVRTAWGIGRDGNVFKRLGNLMMLTWTTKPIRTKQVFNETLLKEQVAVIALQSDVPPKDIRLAIEDGVVNILTDTQTGYILDQAAAADEVKTAIARNKNQTTPITRTPITPSVRLASAENAALRAKAIMAQPITLSSSHRTVRLFARDIGSWITSTADAGNLAVTFNEQVIHAYATTLAQQLKAEPQSPEIQLTDGKAVTFKAPKSGQTLNQEKAATDILAELARRRDASGAMEAPTDIALEINTVKPTVTDVSAAELGITELIGTASTRFTGSPKNRIANIKNGVKFLTGILIKPGEEFSTIKALGTIDNTTGYLPELVIKENRTVPEFGGGLCQVSTTLFRATMNTGLPIIERRNHSYRVSYYEKDGDGDHIGPGLDATIYNPWPDFKFKNDTSAHILIEGHVEGDKITFNFYGTKDGRTSAIDGPYTIASTAAGADVYIETDTLAPGEKKQIEKPHPGGTATATYTIHYPDGTDVVSEYRSVYRNWPAQFLVGVTTATSTPTGDPVVQP